MSVLSPLRQLHAEQRHTVAASYLGWILDAFDFFLLTFVLTQVAADFRVSLHEVTWGLFLTLAARPLGALLFGRLADRYGRRPILMLDVLLFAGFELLSAFAPTFEIFLVLRFLFGMAMGGEWGIGASLALESVPASARGVVSGLLQSGYPVGFFLGALVNWALADAIGWRGLFVVGALPALLVLYIRRKVPESQAWLNQQQSVKQSLRAALRGQGGRVVYLIVLMTAFNMLSHGSQDLYHSFTVTELKLPSSSWQSFLLVALLNLGALVGGILCGSLSERFGRRRVIALACLLALPVIPLWMHGGSLFVLGLGAFLIQLMIQGAWGVVPTHLNELVPAAVRGTLPGLVYQTGNLLAAATPVLQSGWAASGLSLANVLAYWIGAVALLLALLAWLGPEARGKRFDQLEDC